MHSNNINEKLIHLGSSVFVPGIKNEVFRCLPYEMKFNVNLAQSNTVYYNYYR